MDLVCCHRTQNCKSEFSYNIETSCTNQKRRLKTKIVSNVTAYNLCSTYTAQMMECLWKETNARSMYYDLFIICIRYIFVPYFNENYRIELTLNYPYDVFNDRFLSIFLYRYSTIIIFYAPDGYLLQRTANNAMYLCSIIYYSFTGFQIHYTHSFYIHSIILCILKHINKL